MKRTKDLLNKKRSNPERIFFMLMFLFLLLWSVIVIYMLFWTLISSLKTNMEYINTPLGFPEKMQFQNISIALEKMRYNDVGFWGMFANSMWYAGGGALIATFCVCTTGYIFAHYEFKGKTFLFNFVIFMMILPIFGSLPSMYKLIHDLKLNDSYLYTVATCIGGLNGTMLMTYGYYKGVPKELREAIYMDGGNDFVAYLRVYFPLGRNIFVALTLLSFIQRWNDYETPILYFDKLPVLATGLRKFQLEIQYVANTPAYFAGALIVMLPVVIIFALFSDKIMGQLHSGGLKG